MSDSENDDGGGLLGGILWGNLGDNDQLEVDYLDQVRSSYSFGIK